MNKLSFPVILGCTATGKTHLAVNLALKINGEVISADSRQVYRGMDIGTGKDLSEFKIKGVAVPYHLIDIVNAGEDYNVYRYQEDFIVVYNNIVKRKKTPILCGGSGLYIESILKGYRMLSVPKDENYRTELKTKSHKDLEEILISYKRVHNTTDLTSKNRMIRAIEVAKFHKENEAMVRDFPSIDHQIFGIRFEREELKSRITMRLIDRLEKGKMIEEVQGLIEKGVDPNKLKFYGLEYKFVTQYLLSEMSKDEMFDKLNIAIHQFSKRQATWFRKMEREGLLINWIDGNISLEEKMNHILTRTVE